MESVRDFLGKYPLALSARDGNRTLHKWKSLFSRRYPFLHFC
jgi:hypothetical protein